MSREIRRVGGNRTIKVDIRVIAATKQNLQKEVQKGKFREDLFARLNLWTFQLPALRDRKEDIEPNLDFELRRFGEREGQNVTFNKEARDLYLKFAVAPEAIRSR